MENNNLAFIGLGLILITALALAGTAAYQSIVGLADLFAARKEVVIAMAVFIEFAKLLIAGAVHMFWRSLGWWKWGLVAMVAIHMAVTNVGIYSYLSSGYTLQEAPVAALERQIGDLDRRIGSHREVEGEAVRGLEAMDTAYRRLVEGTYVTRAERYERENSEKRAELEAERDAARAEISKLQEERRRLDEAKVAKAAKLGSIEHLAVFTDGSQEDVLRIVALFTILLMMGLDPAAVMMVVLFTHLISKVVRKREPEPTTILSEEEIAEAERLKDTGFMDNQLRKKRRQEEK